MTNKTWEKSIPDTHSQSIHNFNSFVKSIPDTHSQSIHNFNSFVSTKPWNTSYPKIAAEHTDYRGGSRASPTCKIEPNAPFINEKLKYRYYYPF